MSTWMTTFSGQRFDFLELEPRTIKAIDIAHGLSNQHRWNGHLTVQVTTCAHSMAVSAIVPDEFKLQALLHDAEETYTGDIVTPMFRALERCGQSNDALRSLKRNCQAAVLSRFGVNPVLPPEVHVADMAVAATEKEWFLRDIAWENPAGPPSDHARDVLQWVMALPSHLQTLVFLGEWLQLAPADYKIEIGEALREYQDHCATLAPSSEIGD